jgi:hypothetical protein
LELAYQASLAHTLAYQPIKATNSLAFFRSFSLSSIWKAPILQVNLNVDRPKTVFVVRMKTEHLRRERPSGPTVRTTAGPNIRPEKVERARRLIADKSYPPPAVLQKVARVLARKVKLLRLVSSTRQN